MFSRSKNLILGIDIGTTSVKISLLDINKKEIIATNGMKYNFNNENNNNDNESQALPSNCSQQNVQTIISCIQQTLSGIDRQMRQNIGLISICGQMHGCVLWNKNSFWKYNNESFDFTINSSLVSDLYGWQDNRCSPQFISTLPKPDSYVDYISSGFGCATIFWLQRNSPDFIKLFSNSGTIMDFLVCILCDLDVPLISTHNATSYGYFDPIAHCWNTNMYLFI
jgi:sedoheptulokinase